jgi:hypothetical protein
MCFLFSSKTSRCVSIPTIKQAVYSVTNTTIVHHTIVVFVTEYTAVVSKYVEFYEGTYLYYNDSCVEYKFCLLLIKVISSNLLGETEKTTENLTVRMSGVPAEDSNRYLHSIDLERCCYTVLLTFRDSRHFQHETSLLPTQIKGKGKVK